jgi:hypothetical protein
VYLKLYGFNNLERVRLQSQADLLLVFYAPVMFFTLTPWEYSTVDLLTKVACFVKRQKIISIYKRAA